MVKSEINAERFQELRKKAYLDINAPDQAEHTCLSIITEDKTSIIATQGNISLINGKAKSRKTFVVSAIIAALLSNKTIINFTGNLPPEKNKIILFDTEQGIKDSKKVYKRILKMADLDENINHDNFEYNRLRSFSVSDRSNFIEKTIYATKNIGFVVIDGIKDLIYSINDEKEATEISTKLLKWTEELGIHILVLLHQNKTDEQTRGHVGTELLNKAETVIKVKKDIQNKDVSHIESDIMRDNDFDSFAITINEDNIPVLSNDTFSGKHVEIKKIDFVINKIPTKRHYLEIIKPIFENIESCNYEIITNSIKNNFEPIFKIGNNIVQDLLTYYRTNNFITKQGRSYSINKEFNYNLEIFPNDN